MTGHPGKIYSFGGFRLDPAERLLLQGDEIVNLPPKAFDTLRLLVENRGRILAKDRLLQEVWDGAFVEENNLAQNISMLRRALGEADGVRFIETVPKFGYRFVAPVAVLDGEIETVVYEQGQARVTVRDAEEDLLVQPGPASPPLLSSFSPPETRYVQNGDVNIAYQVVGGGGIDIVFVMGWISHLEYFWKHPHFASFLNRLASFSRLILFDKRGTGLSDRVPVNELPTLEQRMEDVHAVMDAVGSERAVLIGVSEGGPMCSLFAATYPERTSALVMFGTYAKRIRDDDYPWAPTIEQREKFFDVMRRDWGKAVGIEERAPSMADDPEFANWWAEYLRMGASPGAAIALTKMNTEIDVRHVLPSVRVPTMVLHRKGDLCLKVEEGRYVASLIPGCKYVELEGIDHLPFVGDQETVLDQIEHFLTGVLHDGGTDRVLATVLRIESHAGHELSATDAGTLAEAFINRQIELFKGRETACYGGSITAVFDGPARAIRCAQAIADSARRLQADIRIALHTGECDVVDGSYGGIAVDLAGRICEAAPKGQVLVSRTVKDLVAGSGIGFSEFDVRSFPGIAGEWRLFTVAA